MDTRIYVLRFTKENADRPIICQLVKKYDIEFNILKAAVLVQQEGLMVLELSGSKANVNKGLAYLKKQGVDVQRIAASIRRDDAKCFQCGACTGICPTGALHLVRPEMAVNFDVDKCSGCGLCVPVCPVRAMEVGLNGTLAKAELQDLHHPPPAE
ncbi:MAG: 4Fe-4S binding protein [Proteobacteria bacterium]|nr:4Fe-4S binding protein [Pseudomonadota bacterium]MBU1710808.1 4Fe-4S binding protein [Pseudomonadota bacterium]